MSRYDLVIFGATGFTGKKVVEEIIKIGKHYRNLTWAVAGRSQSKLKSLLLEVSKISGEDISSTKVIIADVGDAKSIEDMCSQAMVLVNCCGPYRLYGEPVVKAAIDCKTHYVDVSAEHQFIETMTLQYDKAASDAGVYIVSACGLDCIPNDMGVVFMQQQFDGILHSVESYLSIHVPGDRYLSTKDGHIHYGTWESLLYCVAHTNELAPLWKKMYPQRLPTFKPELHSRSIHKHNEKYCVPFYGVDSSIVYRSQRRFYEVDHKHPVQFRPYFKLPNLLFTILAIIGAALLYLMCLTDFTMNLLLKYPRLFSVGLVSHNGPREEVMQRTRLALELYGRGWPKGADINATPPDKKMAVVVSAMDPGYGATATALIFSAVTILMEQDKMPGTGGVLSTGVAFQNTNLIEHLNNNNSFKFQVVDTSDAK